jgi:flagellar assembly factor FliW
MKIATTRFGAVEVAEHEVLEFERGLFGFEDVHRFVLLDRAERSPIKLLQAVDRPELTFAVMEPFLICPDYDLSLSEAEAAHIGWWQEPEILVFVVLGMSDPPSEMTANLKGPIVVNKRLRRGLQVVLPGDRYPARYRVVDALEAGRRRDPDDRARLGSIALKEER